MGRGDLMNGECIMAAGIFLIVFGTICFGGVRSLLWVKKKRLMEEIHRIYYWEE